jgi:putative tricarboxylic transport membrane protein
MYGGSISAILIHTPGTPRMRHGAGGYPMGQRGEAGAGMSIAMFASFIGGVIGALLRLFSSRPHRLAALAFGPAEMFMLAMCGLSVIISISGTSITKGRMALSGSAALLVGMDKSCGYSALTPRGLWLYEGLALLSTLLGLFRYRRGIPPSIEKHGRGELSPCRRP